MLEFPTMSKESMSKESKKNPTPVPLSPIIENLIYSPNPAPAKQLEILDKFEQLHAATLCSSDAPELGKTWEVLDEALKNPSLKTRARAFFLTAGLLYQTGLPQNRKDLWKSFAKKSKGNTNNAISAFQKRSALQTEEAADPNQVLASVRESVEAFSQEMESLKTVPDSKEEAFRQVSLLDLFSKMSETLYFRFYLTYGNPESSTSLVASAFIFMAGKNEGFKTGFYQKLLVEKRLEDTAAELRQSLFLNSWQVEEKENDNEFKKNLYEYFISHPEIQEGFWERFTPDKKPLTLGELKNSTIRDEIERSFKTPPEISILENLLTLDPQTVSGFLSTVPTGYSEKTAFVRKLIGVYAKFKHSGKPGIKAFSNYLIPILEEGKLAEAFINEYRILHDLVPGAILVNKEGEARARVLQPGQTLGESQSIAYVSKAEQIKQAPPEGKEEKNGFSLEAGQLIASEKWGDLQIPAKETMPALFTHLAHALPPGLSEDKLFDLTAEYQEKAINKGNLTVLPSLLENDHPISVLAKIGIIAIQPTEDGIQFIIDAKSAKIKTIGPDTIIVNGKINDKKDLEIKGLEPYTPIHHLLSIAAYLTGTSGTQRELTRDEVAWIRGKVKDWNANKKRPAINFDPNTPPVTGNRAILPIGKKIVYLSLAS